MASPEHILESRSVYDAEKAYLESLLRCAPQSRPLLMAYFDLLSKMSRTHFGVMYCTMPNVRTPVAFRAQTSDLSNMRQIFLNRDYGFEIAPAPRRILDLGAYCGYAALYFANRYPSATIMCVEPSASNFAILTMNTVHYHTIRRTHGASWSRAGSLALVTRIGGGNWGSVFAEREGDAGERVRAYTVQELLNAADWAGADLIKVDIEGGELEVFSDPSAGRWIAGASCISVETHDRFKPGSAAAVEAAISADQFDRTWSGEFVVYRRRQPLPGDERSVAEPILLGGGSPRPIAFDLVNIPHPEWGFRAIDEETWQLHPNQPGNGPAELRVKLRLEGYRRFTSACHLAGQCLHPVIFSACVEVAGVPAVRANVEVPPGATEQLELALSFESDQAELVLATEMAPGAPGNGNAWARWIRPTLA